MHEFECVLFDLGGVLVRVGGVRDMGDLAGIDDDREVWRRWLTCRWVREFESGRCSVEEFAVGIVDDWSLEISPEHFADRFRSWTNGPLDGAVQLVESTRAVLPVACLSNSNALQWENYAQLGLGDLFDRVFLSHELHLIKPDREIFDHVIEQIGCAPDRLLFLDDNELNVEAATQAGIVSAKVVGVDEARSALVQLGILQ